MTLRCLIAASVIATSVARNTTAAEPLSGDKPFFELWDEEIEVGKRVKIDGDMSDDGPKVQAITPAWPPAAKEPLARA